MTLRTQLPDAFQHLVPSDNFHCQTPLKNVKFDLFVSEKYKLANLVANTGRLIVTVLQTTRHAFFGNSKQLQRHDSVTSVVGLYRLQFFWLHFLSHLVKDNKVGVNTG